MIADQTLVTYTGTWRVTLFKNATSIIQDVSSGLQSSGLPVRSFNSDAGFLTDVITAHPEFNVTLNIQVENSQGFDKPDDIISIIRYWVNKVTGNFPLSDSIPYLQVPGESQRSTGQPSGAPKGVAGCLAGTSSDAAGNFSLTCWFGNLTTKGLTSVGFVALLAFLGIGLIFLARPAAVVEAAGHSGRRRAA